MLRFLLDTNLCIRAIKDRPKGMRDRFNEAGDSLCISTITLYELLYGAEKSVKPQENRMVIENFAARLAVLPFDETGAAHAADIRAVLERRGERIGPYDLLIAGHARSRGLVLVTGNLGEFERVEGLRVENWQPSI